MNFNKFVELSSMIMSSLSNGILYYIFQKSPSYIWEKEITRIKDKVLVDEHQFIDDMIKADIAAYVSFSHFDDVIKHNHKINKLGTTFDEDLISRVKERTKTYYIDRALESIKPDDSDVSTLVVMLSTAWTSHRHSLTTTNFDEYLLVNDLILLSIPAFLSNLSLLRGFMGIQPMNGPVDVVHSISYDEDSGSLRMMKHAIEAYTRKLALRINISYPMSDLEIEETAHALGAETAEEYRHILFDILNHIDATPSNASDMTGLLLDIKAKSNDIGKKTRRGCANKIIMSPMLLVIFQTFSREYKSYENVTAISGNPVGNIDGMDVYIDMYCALGEKIAIAYKGSTDTDAGIFLAPYNPLMLSQQVLDPNTFEPTRCGMTRYGLKKLDNAYDYYGVIDVSEFMKKFHNKS